MTRIEWTKSDDGTPGRSWNSVTGCDPISEGCAHCYARRMARRLAGRAGYPEYPHHFDVTLRPERLDEPLRWRKPSRIFVVSMGDLFHGSVPFEFVHQVFETMEQAQWHTYILLTKRPERMHKFIEIYSRWRNWPLPGVWLGVTVENQARADERIPLLLQTLATVRWVSYEPALGPVNFTQITADAIGRDALRVDASHCVTGRPEYHLDWVVAGAETGPGARPMDLDWARDARDQCTAAGVRFFFKRGSDGSRLLDGRLHEEWPEVSNDRLRCDSGTT